MKKKSILTAVLAIAIAVVSMAKNTRHAEMSTQRGIDYASFLAQHDMVWDTITADPTNSHSHAGRRTGYYAGALMGNGLLGTNFYKLRNGVYRLNVGRSDVTEARRPYNLFNSARLPIGYFTLATVGNVTKEHMRLSLYDAETQGTLDTDRGSIDFKTYVHATRNCIVFETDAKSGETGYKWAFVPQRAISPRAIYGGSGQPANYLNSKGMANPDAYAKSVDGCQMIVQPLASDSSFSHIARYYVVAWRELSEGTHRRIIATVAQRNTLDETMAEAIGNITSAMDAGCTEIEQEHKDWWHGFYGTAAFVSMPDAYMESFYWAQYYKFASTARPGKPIVDLQGVWPTYDTTWPAIWMNLNIQLTYSWLTKANLGMLEQPLWDSFWNNRDNLTRNVTLIPGQETWADSRVMPRSSTYDMLAPLDPKTASRNQYEVGNLTWTLFYYWQQCVAYGDTLQMRERLFPLLKSAVNMFFHIRKQQPDGTYVLPPTASPEYMSTEVGNNANYDLANLRWGLQTLIALDSRLGIGDEMLPKWKDFLSHLAPFPYSEKTGFKISDRYEFLDTTHRHYSHLFMIYPYHLLDWDNPSDRQRIELSVSRWNGNQGYSRTGKAAMLASKGDGNGALKQMQMFFKRYVRPNTLYNETGPVIETPLAAVSTLHDMYMQDWGDRIRVFWGCPDEWREASFVGLRAKGAFLVSARRSGGKTSFVQVESEKGGLCRIQTGMDTKRLLANDANGKRVKVKTVDASRGTIEFDTKEGMVVQIVNKGASAMLPQPIRHNASEANPFGDGTRDRKYE